MMRARLETLLPPFIPIPVTCAVHAALDSSFLDTLPRPPDTFMIRSRAMRMTELWQATQFNEADLRSLGFTTYELMWLRTIAAHHGVSLGMIAGENPLLAVPGRGEIPVDLLEGLHWIYTSAIWQLIGRENLLNTAKERIQQLLAPTPYRIGMPAATLFVSTG